MGLLVGHGSRIMGHVSLSAWVTGSWVNASDPLPALEASTVIESNIHGSAVGPTSILDRGEFFKLTNGIVGALKL